MKYKEILKNAEVIVIEYDGNRIQLSASADVDKYIASISKNRNIHTQTDSYEATPETNLSGNIIATHQKKIFQKGNFVSEK